MLKFLRYLKKQWWLVGLIFVFTCVQVILDFLLPTLMGWIIRVINNGATTPVDMNEIISTAIGMIFIAFCSGLVGSFICILASQVTAKMMARVRYQLYDKISTFSANEMNHYSVSSLITRTTNDITNVSNTYVLIFRFLIYGPLLAVGAFIFLLTSGCRWQLLCTIIGAILLLALVIFIAIRVALPHFEIIQQRIDKINLVTKENLEGLRVVRAYNAEEFQREKFSNYNEQLTKDDKTANRALGFLTPGIQLVIGIMMVAVSLVSANLIKEKSGFDYSSMATVLQFAGLLLTGFILMVLIFIMIPRSTICAKRINEILESDVLIKYVDKTEQYSEVGTVEFKNVTFTYPGGDAPSLKNITFRVNKGETLAFIGATGSGKTTLLNLIQRFYDASEGQVLVDGLDVKKYRGEDLFIKFGYVPQKPYLFRDTLRNNVCLGAPNASDEELKRALDISQSSEFVEKLHGKTEYEISQGGKNVSGGQRQRLSIARAIIKRPEIFLFDDSFSALDYKTDRVVRGEIKSKCQGSTNIIVAQRVGTIMDADQIVVLDNGNMVGIGTHKELLKTCSVYREIALSQLSKEELENA